MRDDDFATHTTPYKRLKFVREKLVRLTRARIEEKYGLSAATLKAWENGTATLTAKGLTKCEEIYRQEGFSLDKNWVLHGTGAPMQISFLDKPKVTYLLNADTKSDSDRITIHDRDKLIPYLKSDEMCMAQEASLFKELYTDAVVLIVTNEDMLPKYRIGDYVGGRFRYAEAINSAVNRDCIVRLRDGRDILRRLMHGRLGGYNLAAINPNTTNLEPVLFNVEVIAAAPVIWHRVPNN